MLRRIVATCILAFLMLLNGGCPSSSDRLFEQYGIYYGVAPEGYIAAQYQVAASERGRIGKVEAFKSAATELAEVLSGSRPLRNGTKVDLMNARTVTIMLLYVDPSLPRDERDEVFGVAVFLINEIAKVAQFGPTEEMQINDPSVWNEKVEVIAAREHKRLVAQ